MSKYLEFKQIPYKGKTKRFEIISKNSIGDCQKCYGKGWYILEEFEAHVTCKICNGTGRTDIILGRIMWEKGWRQYIFSPSYPTIWSKDCLQDLQDFLQQLMDERKSFKKLPFSIDCEK